jgi:hypothetical protein
MTTAVKTAKTEYSIWSGDIGIITYETRVVAKKAKKITAEVIMMAFVNEEK